MAVNIRRMIKEELDALNKRAKAWKEANQTDSGSVRNGGPSTIIEPDRDKLYTQDVFPLGL